MFDYVIDTNIVMSMLISGKSQYRTILSFFKFYLPEYSLTELDEHKDIIFEKTKFNKQELSDFIYFVFSSVFVIPTFALSSDAIKNANKICKKVDIKDVSFVALANDIDKPLLTRDEKLYTGLRKQGYRNIILFDDFLKQIR